MAFKHSMFPVDLPIHIAGPKMPISKVLGIRAVWVTSTPMEKAICFGTNLDDEETRFITV